jgi:perosamine synthetase
VAVVPSHGIIGSFAGLNSDLTLLSEFIPVAEPDFGGNEEAYLVDCLRSTWISSIGPYVSRFEKDFAQFCGTRFALSTSNGTTALHVTLAALGIGPGAEVIVPTLTFIATANAVAYTGAKVVFADSEYETWNVSSNSIQSKISNRTKAIIAVHVYGHPADMDSILEVARQYELPVVEDAAEAHGAEYKGARVGSLGVAGIFSFYGNKIITTGEGGMVTLDDPELAQRATFLKDHAMSSERRYWHPEIGFNYRLTNLQAAIGVAQLEQVDTFIEKKRANAMRYNALLKGIRGITLPPAAAWAKNVYWMYSILLDDAFPLGRDELILQLRRRGIDSRPFFYPLHTMPPYARNESYPVAEDLARRGLNLPSSSRLTPEQIERVCSAIREVA